MSNLATSVLVCARPQMMATATSSLKSSSRSLRSWCSWNIPSLSRSLSSTPSRRNSGWGRGKVLAIRREETNIWERRAPLNPNLVQSLVREGVKVSPSKNVCTGRSMWAVIKLDWPAIVWGQGKLSVWVLLEHA